MGRGMITIRKKSTSKMIKLFLDLEAVEARLFSD